MTVVVGLGGLVGCDPTDLPTLTVTSDATGADASPGDGVCEATAGAGDCTLPAAVDEANALGRAAISVPAGSYENMDLTVTGNVRLNMGTSAEVVLGDVDITVAEGGVLKAEGLSTLPTYDDGAGHTFGHPVTLSVAGELYLARSTIVSYVDGQVPDIALVVAPGGRAVLNTSVLFGWQDAVENDGELVLLSSSLFSLVSSALVTNEGTTSQLARSVAGIAASGYRLVPECSGAGSLVDLGGNNAVGGLGCGFDQSRLNPYNAVVLDTFTMTVVWPSPSGPIIDAIPIGTLLCSQTDTDLYGNPRAVDGDGDGVAACDSGAAEYQP